MIWAHIKTHIIPHIIPENSYHPPYHPPYHPSPCHIIPHIIPLNPYHPPYHPSQPISSLHLIFSSLIPLAQIKGITNCPADIQYRRSLPIPDSKSKSLKVKSINHLWANPPCVAFQQNCTESMLYQHDLNLCFEHRTTQVAVAAAGQFSVYYPVTSLILF